MCEYASHVPNSLTLRLVCMVVREVVLNPPLTPHPPLLLVFTLLLNRQTRKLLSQVAGPRLMYAWCLVVLYTLNTVYNESLLLPPSAFLERWLLSRRVFMCPLKMVVHVFQERVSSGGTLILVVRAFRVNFASKTRAFRRHTTRKCRCACAEMCAYSKLEWAFGHECWVRVNGIQQISSFVSSHMQAIRWITNDK